MTLYNMLQEIGVLSPEMWENETGPAGWYAVVDATGIIAYFAREEDACAFRLWLINLRVNGGAIAARYGAA